MSAGARHRRTSSSHSKPWERPGHLYRSSTSRSRPPDPEEIEPISRQGTRTSTRSKRREPKWFKIRLFQGMIADIKRRAPYYWSDWRDAWDYRVVPATVYMYVYCYPGPRTAVVQPCWSLARRRDQRVHTLLNYDHSLATVLDTSCGLVIDLSLAQIWIIWLAAFARTVKLSTHLDGFRQACIVTCLTCH
jgi:hypothetical protein